MEKSKEEIIAEVREKYPSVQFPEPVLEPMWYGRKTPIRITGHKAIVDKNTGVVFSYVTDSYRLVRYEETVALAEAALKGTGFDQFKLCPNFLSDGGKLKLSMKFDGTEINIASGDAIIPKVDIFSSYDTKWKLSGMFGAFRLKCKNGMGVWKAFKKFSRKHLYTLDMAELSETITTGMSYYVEQQKMWEDWPKLQVSQDLYESLWEFLPFSTAEKTKIEALPEVGTKLTIPEMMGTNNLSMWGLNNIFTQFATHGIQSELRKVELEPAIAKVMEETYYRMKEAA